MEENLNYQKSSIKLYLKASDKLYKTYLKNPIYLYAKGLYKINSLILLELKNIDDDRYVDLICHYAIWLSEFEVYEKKLEPSVSDRFQFQSIDTCFHFPKNIFQKQ